MASPDQVFLDEQDKEIRYAQAMIRYYQEKIEYHRALKLYFIADQHWQVLVERDMMAGGLQAEEGSNLVRPVMPTPPQFPDFD